MKRAKTATVMVSDSSVVKPFVFGVDEEELPTSTQGFVDFAYKAIAEAQPQYAVAKFDSLYSEQGLVANTTALRGLKRSKSGVVKLYVSEEDSKKGSWAMRSRVTVGSMTFALDRLLDRSWHRSRWVFLCFHDEQPYVMKVEHGADQQIPREHHVLTQLAGVAGVPRAVAVDLGHDSFLVTLPYGVLVDSSAGPKHIGKVCIDVLKILEEVHNMGYVHGDVSPDHFILADGRVYLIDWGAALRIGSVVRVSGKQRFTSSRLVECHVSGGEGISIGPMDDVESLLHSMDALLNRSRQQRCATGYTEARAIIERGCFL